MDQTAKQNKPHLDEDEDLSAWVDDSTGNTTSGEDQSLFLRLKTREEPYRVRLVKNKVSFRRHWNPFGRAVISPASASPGAQDKHKDIAWAEGGWFPLMRHATLVIDRADGRLRILEAGNKVFNPIIEYARHARRNPSGKLAPDFVIESKMVGKQVTYSCHADYDGPKPLTEEEREMVDRFTYDWQGRYVPVSPEDLRRLWEALPVEKRYNPQDKKAAEKIQALAAGHAPSQTSRAAASSGFVPAVDAPEDSPFEGEGEAESESNKEPLVTGGDSPF